MDKMTIAGRLNEVLGKQRPEFHGIAIGYVDSLREIPNITGVQYFLGSHDECSDFFDVFANQPTIESARGACMTVNMN